MGMGADGKMKSEGGNVAGGLPSLPPPLFVFVVMVAVLLPPTVASNQKMVSKERSLPFVVQEGFAQHGVSLTYDTANVLAASRFANGESQKVQVEAVVDDKPEMCTIMVNARDSFGRFPRLPDFTASGCVGEPFMVTGLDGLTSQ